MNAPILITGCARSGVYEIFCKDSGKRYVGSSVNLELRRKGHFKDLKNKKHHNIHLQRAWEKYGSENFTFTPLFFCEKKDLVFFEQRAINEFHASDHTFGFNICPIAESRLGAKFTSASKKQLSKSRRGKYTGEQNHNFGKQLSDDTRKKISESLIGRFVGKNSPSYGRVHSDEERQKISLTNKGRDAWNKGLTSNCDSRVAHQAESLRGRQRSVETKNKISASLKGIPLSDNTKKKLSEAQTKRWSNPEARKIQSEKLKRSHERRGANHAN